MNCDVPTTRLLYTLTLKIVRCNCQHLLCEDNFRLNERFLNAITAYGQLFSALLGALKPTYYRIERGFLMCDLYLLAEFARLNESEASTWIAVDNFYRD